MNPDPAFLYPSKHHAGALTMLEYAMVSQSPFCMLTGEIGSGKTTLIQQLIRSLDDSVIVGMVHNSHGRFRSIHPWALSALGITPNADTEIGQYEALVEFFIREYGYGRHTLLIFDEAQNLSVRTLEELRLLSNVNSENDVALQIMLVGQPELRRKLERPQLKQFAQRVAVDFHLNALSRTDAHAYVRHRLRVAGGSDAIFHRKAIDAIHKLSGGIPRLINQLCDLCLVYAFADGRPWVAASTVAQVMRDRGDRTKAGLFAGGVEIAPLTAVPTADASEDSACNAHTGP